MKFLSNKKLKFVLLPSLLILFNLFFLMPQARAADSSCSNLLDQFKKAGDPSTGIAGSLPQICNPFQLLNMEVGYMLAFAGGIAVVFIIIGGYLYITAAGNEEQAEKGRKTL